MNTTDALWVSNGLLWAVVLVQALVLVELLRQVGILRLRVGDEPGALLVDGEGLGRGSPAPAFSARDLRTGQLVISTELVREKSLLVFLTTRCQACRTLVPAVNEVAKAHRRDLHVLLVCSNPGVESAECAELARAVSPLVSVVFDDRQQITRDYHVERTPSATLIADNIVRLHAIPNSREQLESLVDEEISVSHGEWLKEGTGEEVQAARLR